MRVRRITEGYRTDMVILDSATVADFGWPDHPADPPTEIHCVLIAGRPALLPGALIAAGGRFADAPRS